MILNVFSEIDAFVPSRRRSNTSAWRHTFTCARLIVGHKIRRKKNKLNATAFFFHRHVNISKSLFRPMPQLYMGLNAFGAVQCSATISLNKFNMKQTTI